MREIPGSNFLLLLVWLAIKFDFHVANLLLATANFKPCNQVFPFFPTVFSKAVFVKVTKLQDC